MPLITSTTNLNKLKFGSDNSGDRFASGFSNQPYIRKDIPGVDVDNSNPTPITQLDSSGQPIYGDLPPSSLDILFRGGLNAPRDAATDVSRLSKMFFDTRSPNGLIFTANQQLLSRTSVQTEATYGAAYGRNTQPDFLKGTGGGALASGIYLPTSTLAQAGVGFTGTHLNLMGLDPTSPNGITGQTSGLSNLFGATGPGAGLRTYSSVMSLNNLSGDFTQNITTIPNPTPTLKDDTLTFNDIRVNNVAPSFNNRLINIFQDRQQVTSTSPDVISYQGGPGSILGIGDTNIRFAGGNLGGTTRTGVNNSLALNNGQFYFYGKDPTYKSKGVLSPLYNNFQTRLGLTEVAKNVNIFGNVVDVNNNSLQNLNSLSSTYTLAGSLPGDNDENSTSTSRGVYSARGNNTKVYNFQQIKDQAVIAEGSSDNNTDNFQDFRAKLIETGGESGNPLQDSNILSISPSYKYKSGIKRVNLGSPGSKQNVLYYGVDANKMRALDKINALPMYVSSGPKGLLAINDYVKFRIAAIDNAPDANGEAVYMHFRAFIDSFSDTYNSTWNANSFSGRGDKLYSYTGYDRKISLSFTCYAQSKAELIPMYKKLNYLASTMTPDYNTAGFMRGNLVRLTLGGYLYEQPGFISSMTYEVPQQSNWEISIDENGGSDQSVKELPFMIKVTGMSFTPIQDFLPQKIKPSAANGLDNGRMIDERYIALTNGITTNYKDEYREYEETNTVEPAQAVSELKPLPVSTGTSVGGPISPSPNIPPPSNRPIPNDSPGTGTAIDPGFEPANTFTG
jgi:hypothetical protein